MDTALLDKGVSESLIDGRDATEIKCMVCKDIKNYECQMKRDGNCKSEWNLDHIKAVKRGKSNFVKEEGCNGHIKLPSGLVQNDTSSFEDRIIHDSEPSLFKEQTKDFKANFSCQDKNGENNNKKCECYSNLASSTKCSMETYTAVSGHSNSECCKGVDCFSETQVCCTANRKRKYQSSLCQEAHIEKHRKFCKNKCSVQYYMENLADNSDLCKEATCDSCKFIVSRVMDTECNTAVIKGTHDKTSTGPLCPGTNAQLSEALNISCKEKGSEESHNSWLNITLKARKSVSLIVEGDCKCDFSLFIPGNKETELHYHVHSGPTELGAKYLTEISYAKCRETDQQSLSSCIKFISVTSCSNSSCTKQQTCPNMYTSMPNGTKTIDPSSTTWGIKKDTSLSINLTCCPCCSNENIRSSAAQMNKLPSPDFADKENNFTFDVNCISSLNKDQQTSKSDKDSLFHAMNMSKVVIPAQDHGRNSQKVCDPKRNIHLLPGHSVKKSSEAIVVISDSDDDNYTPEQITSNKHVENMNIVGSCVNIKDSKQCHVTVKENCIHGSKTLPTCDRLSKRKLTSRELDVSSSDDEYTDFHPWALPSKSKKLEDSLRNLVPSNELHKLKSVDDREVGVENDGLEEAINAVKEKNDSALFKNPEFLSAGKEKQNTTPNRVVKEATTRLGDEHFNQGTDVLFAIVKPRPRLWDNGILCDLCGKGPSLSYGEWYSWCCGFRSFYCKCSEAHKRKMMELIKPSGKKSMKKGQPVKSSLRNSTADVLSGKVHRMCGLWSSEVYEKDDEKDQLGELLEAVRRGRSLFCKDPDCHMRGATLGCRVKQCHKSFHYPCALKLSSELRCRMWEGSTRPLACDEHRHVDHDCVSAKTSQSKIESILGSKNSNQTQGIEKGTNNLAGITKVHLRRDVEHSKTKEKNVNCVHNEIVNSATGSTIGVRDRIFYLGQNLLCEDIAEGKEALKIPCTNDIDDGPFPQFEYIRFRRYSDDAKSFIKNIQKENSKRPPACDGCFHCDMDSPQGALSVHVSVVYDSRDGDKRIDWQGEPMYGRLPYNSYGLLQLGWLTTDVLECNKQCKCGPKCTNSQLQKGLQIALEVYKTQKRGWGVRTLEQIPRGKFVIEYVGEVLIERELDNQSLKYCNYKSSYLFNMDHPTLSDEELLVVDGFKFSNVSRFINHSCESNLSIYRVYTESLDKRIFRIGLYASRDIDIGEELTYDYKFIQEYEEPNFPDYFQCFCEAENCRQQR